MAGINLLSLILDNLEISLDLRDLKKAFFLRSQESPVGDPNSWQQTNAQRQRETTAKYAA